MSTTAEVAQTLVTLCREGKFGVAVDTLYSQDIVSVEPENTPNHVMTGFEAVKQKEVYFNNSFDVHGADISDAVVNGNHFSVTMSMDVTQKDINQRYVMSEICVYEVKEGKIVREQFFY